MVRLKDIAKEAGMSVTQVSRALNNHNDVSEDTKVRIREIAKKMGYVKNMAAQKLVMQVSNQISLVIKGFENISSTQEYNSIYPILCGINQCMNETKYEVVTYILQEHVSSYIEYFQERGISQAILVGFEYDDEKLHELLESNYTCVCIDIPVEGQNKGCVITNNTLYAAQAVEALLESGKKHIAMISGTSHAIVSIEREAGYRVALRKRKIEIREEWIFNGNFQQDQAKEVALKALTTYPEIDGFFCASDYMALGCMEAVESLGKKIPEDIAIIGFDNIPVTKYVKPKLSTVAQDDYRKGYEAAKLLIQLANKENVQKTVMLNCEIILRESVF